VARFFPKWPEYKSRSAGAEGRETVTRRRAGADAHAGSAAARFRRVLFGTRVPTQRATAGHRKCRPGGGRAWHDMGISRSDCRDCSICAASISSVVRWERKAAATGRAIGTQAASAATLGAFAIVGGLEMSYGRLRSEDAPTRTGTQRTAKPRKAARVCGRFCARALIWQASVKCRKNRRTQCVHLLAAVDSEGPGTYDRMHACR